MQGKVPRNEYGNVEMFKPSMLPIGGAHVQSELCRDACLPLCKGSECNQLEHVAMVSLQMRNRLIKISVLITVLALHLHFATDNQLLLWD